MQERDTINILISQLLCKDDEILSLRNQLATFQKQQEQGNNQILQKLDKALNELQNMRKDNKNLANRLSKALKDKAEAEKESAALSQALEVLKSTRAEELFEIEKHKRRLYGRKSEKASLLKKGKEKDIKQDKDDFDGTGDSGDPNDYQSLANDTNQMDGMNPSDDKRVDKSSPKVMRMRTDYSKNATQVKNVVRHFCDRDSLPADARQIDHRYWILYKLDWSITKHEFEVLHLIDKEGSISNYYEPLDKLDEMKPYQNVLPGLHVDIDMIAQIMVDKYQYSMSLERVVNRLKDVDASFSSSTVLNWIHKHTEALIKLEAPLKELLLHEGSFLFCDETTELVRVLNEATGKYEYRKKYIWAIKNPALKVAYYLYDNGSRSMRVAETFFRDFFGSITTDGYNVYKLFDRAGSKITRYGCMAHVRRKFLDALNTDGRSAEILSLISELYWIESDMKIHFLSEPEREKERKERSVPVLSDIWQRIKVIFDQAQGQSANLFIKAVRYAVNEWESVCRYVTNGKAEIDNNTAERMMKPICLGRNNYLFCGSERAARNASLLYSIIETCKMNGIRPVKYIADVLRKLVAGETDYTALLPINIEK